MVGASARSGSPFQAVGRFIGWGEAGLPPSAIPAAATEMRWPAALALNAGVQVCLAAAAATASRAGWPYAAEAYFAAVALLLFPYIARVISWRCGRTEHLINLAVLTGTFFLLRFVREPVAFVDHDEFLHWSTANAILETRYLFSPNPLLPVSPLYPGLELATTALVNLSGLSVFAAGNLLLAAARLSFMGALFLLYERITGSAHVAACGCLVYMGASTFLIFDTQFSYGSLAVTLLMVAMLAGAVSERRGAWILTVALLAALAATHHMTAFFAALLFTAIAALECLRLAPAGRFPWGAATVAVLSVLLPLGWSRLMGDPNAHYLGPVLAGGLQELYGVLTLASRRTLFLSEDGAYVALWQRSITVAAAALISLGLLTGFLRSLALAGLCPTWRTLTRPGRLLAFTDSRLIVLTGLTLAFPLGILFRLTHSGWEIGNRIGPFSFIGAGIVVAIGVALYWQGRSPSRSRTACISAAGTCIVIGGIISGPGPILIPRDYRVSADAATIEPMSIAAAEWSGSWLGPGNLFAADRVNRLLLATYGRQDVSTSLLDKVDIGSIVLARTMSAQERALLRNLRIDYLSVDLRLTLGLPFVGSYFDGGDLDRGRMAPPRAELLQKFDFVPGIGRVFDNGYIVTYDVRGFHAGR
jgi:general stress protein CsbA